jgi:hypothetical protein
VPADAETTPRAVTFQHQTLNHLGYAARATIGL